MRYLLCALISFLVGALAATFAILIFTIPWLEQILEWWKEQNPPTTEEAVT